MKSKSITSNAKLSESLRVKNDRNNNLISHLTSEVMKAKLGLEQRDAEIVKLTTNLKFIKAERDEKIVEVNNFIAKMENFETKTFLPIKNKIGTSTPEVMDFTNHHVRINKDSLFSLHTYTTGTGSAPNENNNKFSLAEKIFEEKQCEIQGKIDNLQKQKTSLENDLVHFKLKYAENSARIMDLEDDFMSMKNKNEVKF